MENLFEFHCHSNYSKDSGIKIEDIIKACEKSGVTGLALTDHNEISGALELKRIAPAWLKVIVGEEIETSEGEIIGIFLKEKINPGMSPNETFSEIRKQGGLIVIPHPFDRLRSKKMPNREIEKYINNFDAIETFNARNVFEGDNKKAREFAENNHKPQICGSDAHFFGEYGKTFMKNIDCQGSQEFLESLKKAEFVEKKASLFFHLMTKYKKITNKK
jgi:hypothetical protein